MRPYSHPDIDHPLMRHHLGRQVRYQRPEGGEAVATLANVTKDGMATLTGPGYGGTIIVVAVLPVGEVTP